MAELTFDEAGALAPLVRATEVASRVGAGAVLIDVRSEAGRLSAGPLPGATVVAKDEVAARFDIGSPGAVQEVTSKGTPIVVVCGSVRGSGPVAAELIARGFTDVVHVEGGFPAWQETANETVPPTA